MALHALARRLRPAAALALLAAVLALAVAATGRARLAPADFVMNNGTEVKSLDPAKVTGVPEGRMIRFLYEGLVIAHPETLEPLPGVAERWEVSEDGRTYTFHLRENARWSDGSPLIAEDLRWSFERFLHPKTGAEYAYQLWYVEGAEAFTTEVDGSGEPRNDFSTVGITAPDERTLVFRLNAPTAFFMDLMSFYPLFPVSRRCIEDAQERFPFTWEQEWLKPENLVNNGPYVVEFRRINDRIRLTKNPHYWNADEVAFETIDVLAVEQYTTMLNMYLTGEVHWIDRVATNAVQTMIRREDFVPVPYLGSYFFRVNVNEPPLDDVRVRRALALTIPRQAICDNVMKAGQVPAYSLVPPGIEGYELALMEHSGDLARDADEARRLLAEAGYGPGGRTLPPIELHYNTSEAHRDIAEVIGAAWSRELGIETKLLNQEWKVYLDTQKTINFDVSRSAWIGDYADPNTFVDLFVTDGENNRTGWSNAEYDRLVREASLELDPARRLELMHAAERICMDELPILPVYYYVTQSIYSPRLGGFIENVKDEHFPQHWYWMDDEELAAKRARYPDDGRHGIVEAWGPPEGLYSPAEQRRRSAQ